MNPVSRGEDAQAIPRRSLRGLEAALGLVFLAGAALFTLWFLPHQRASEIARWTRDLGVQADLRRAVVDRYFEDALASATTVASYPSNLQALEHGTGGAATRHLVELFEVFDRSQGAVGTALWDKEATPVVATQALALDDGCARAAREALASGKAVVGIHLHETRGPVLTFSAPVQSRDGVTRGAVTVFEDPDRWLYPFLARKLSGIDTGEAALVARDGADVLLLSPLRQRPDAPLRFRRPLGSLGFGAQAAFEGSEEVSSQTDYRGVRVFATGRRLAHSSWALVMKTDEAEVLRGFYASARRTATSLGAFLLAASALVWGLVQRRERLQLGAIASSEERYRALFDGMLNGVAYCQMLWEDETPVDFIYLVVNRAFGTLTGLEDVVGRRISEIIPGFKKENPEVLEAYGRVANTGVPETLESFVPALGIWFSISAYSPKKGYFVAVFDNFTEKKKAEETLAEAREQLAQAQKMEAVGRLAGGIAHDFNNILTVIRGYGELLAASLETDDARREELAEVLRAAERATDLTRQLLAFSRRQTLEMQPLDLGAVAANAEKMLRRLIGEDVRLTFSQGEGSGFVCADRGQVEQVLMNLAVNARDAMPDGGPLAIGVSGAAVVTALAAVGGAIPPGRYVVLSVADGGCGMTKETLAHAFEPFFTTKETGRGTGLGLSTVFGIVRQSRGHIRVTSAPGAGTTIELFFPRVDEADLTRRARAAPAV